jgi:hypothetical protein
LKFTYRDFEKLWGVSLNETAIDLIEELSYEYETLSVSNEVALIDEILDEIHQDKFTKAGPSREASWETGWNENLREYAKSQDVKDLIPKYFGKSRINRLGQHFVLSKSKNFDLNMLRAIQARVFTEYLSDHKNVYEFGCGTGHNLLFLRRINPACTLYGLDWAHSSQKILELLSQSGVDKNIHGKNFDYYLPDFSFKMRPSSAVFTIASLEQIGDRHQLFIDYLMENKPAIVVHVEPFRDLLDNQNPVDLSSIEYMKQRNYIEGYCESIFELQRERKAHVHLHERTFIGSKYVDGYTILVWSPSDV